VVADASGAYRVEGVAPGRHRLEAHDPGDDSVSCVASSGACVSGRSAAHAAVTVVVPSEGGEVVVDVDL
nr:hypothetical protein [Actinomycetota bacterium]